MTVIGRAFVEVQPRTNPQQFQQQAERGIIGPIKNVAKTAAVAFGGVFAAQKVFGFVGDALNDARDANKINRQTEAVIKSTGGAAKVTADQVEAMSQAFQNQLGVSDEVAQETTNLLLTFTNLRNEVGEGNDILTQATQIALDMSVALQGSATNAKQGAVQLGKALNDPIAGITALTRVGVTFTDQQKEQIRTMVESGDLMSAQKVILAELTKEFGGSAAANKDAMDSFAVVWDDMTEAFGQFLLPVLESIAAFGAEVLPGIQSGIGIVAGAFGDAFSGIAQMWSSTGMQAIFDALGGASDFFGGVGDFFGRFGGPEVNAAADTAQMIRDLAGQAAFGVASPEDIKNLQAAMAVLGQPIAVDGIWGTETQRAAEEYLEALEKQAKVINDRNNSPFGLAPMNEGDTALERFGNRFETLFDDIDRGSDRVGNWLRDLVGLDDPEFDDNFQRLREKFEQLPDAFFPDDFGGLYEQFIDGVDKIWPDDMGEFFDNIWPDGISRFADDVWPDDFFDDLWPDDLAGNLLQSASTIFEAPGWLWDAIFEPAWDFVADTAVLTWRGLLNVLTDAGALIGGAASWLWDSLFVPAWDWIVENAEEFATDPLGVFGDIGEWVWSAIGASGSWLWDSIFEPAWSFVSDTIPNAAAIALNWFGDIGGHIWELIKAGVGAAGDAGAWLWDSVFQPAWDWITDNVASLGGHLAEAIKGAIETAINTAIDGYNAVAESVPSFDIPNPFGDDVTIGLPTFDHIQLATGGILKRAVFVAGEAGQEAVLPLPPGVLEGLATIGRAAVAQGAPVTAPIVLVNALEALNATIAEANATAQQLQPESNTSFTTFRPDGSNALFHNFQLAIWDAISTGRPTPTGPSVPIGQETQLPPGFGWIINMETGEAVLATADQIQAHHDALQQQANQVAASAVSSGLLAPGQGLRPVNQSIQYTPEGEPYVPTPGHASSPGINPYTGQWAGLAADPLDGGGVNSGFYGENMRSGGVVMHVHGGGDARTVAQQTVDELREAQWRHG